MLQTDFAVIVFNPNLNVMPLQEKRPKIEEMFIPGKPRPKEPPQVMKIPKNEGGDVHTIYVWDKFASKSKAKDLLIIAHSAGGWCTMQLLKERQDEVLSRLRAIAFTDSVHSVMKRDPPLVKKFISQHAKNWVQSDKPLDTLCSRATPDSCEEVSSGHPKHENTSSSAITSVFKWLGQKLDS